MDTLTPPWMYQVNRYLMTLVPNLFFTQTTPRRVYESLLIQQSQLDCLEGPFGAPDVHLEWSIFFGARSIKNPGLGE